MSPNPPLRLASVAGGRDGKLVVVAPDHRRCLPAPTPWLTLQAALDDWASAAPRLAEHYARLVADPTLGEPVEVAVAPLPRAFQWAEASTYLSHMRRIRAARGVPMPPGDTGPVLYQAVGAPSVAPCARVPLGDPAWGLDLEATVCVITTDVARGASVAAAEEAIVLVGLTNDLTYRRVMGREYRNGVGPFVAKPPRPYTPVVASPAALGQAWGSGRLHARLEIDINDRRLGTLDTAQGTGLGFAEIVSAAAASRPLTAGSMLGSGTVSNPDEAVGFACLAEELAVTGGNVDEGPYLQAGDRVRIEAFGADGASLFGAIDTIFGEEPR